MTREECKQKWAADAAALLVGRTIKAVRYLTDEEQDFFGWYRSGLVIILDNGIQIVPSADDEGNDAGALFTNHGSLETIPVI
jgi:hypothetical protein